MNFRVTVLGFLLLFSSSVIAQSDTYRNPFDRDFIKKNLPTTSPKLGITQENLPMLKHKIESDSVLAHLYQAFKENAKEIYRQPLLEREMIGRRLLGTSREMLYRVNVLGMIYLIEQDEKALSRLEEEIRAVCNFPDWNPAHFLDVGEMALAVATALDWTQGNLSPATQKLARSALVENAIQPSFLKNPNWNWWISASNNWNQVCHAGLIAASLVIAYDEPALAAQTISRALDSIPIALASYAPDGVYPEGPGYWDYGTTFTCVTINQLRSAFNDDFGISKAPGFLESATFRYLSFSSSNQYFNYSDCGRVRDSDGDFTLAWFAQETGNLAFYERDRFMRPIEAISRLDRNCGYGLIWLAKFSETGSATPPEAWKGDGINPIAILKKDSLYFATKGGRPNISHGHMDAGSFVWEVGGTRWSLDPPPQSYNVVEQAGLQLWANCQDCDRWKLLSNNNFGHSTLTINDQLHRVDQKAPIIRFEEQPLLVQIDLTPAFRGMVDQANRTFRVEDSKTLLIEDSLVLNDSTKTIIWQMITDAEVVPFAGGATLKKDGKKVNLEIMSHPDLSVSLVSLDPPPMELDKQIDNLKRIEIHFPAYVMRQGEQSIIQVRLSAR